MGPFSIQDMNNQISYKNKNIHVPLPGAVDVRSKRTLDLCTHEGQSHTIQALAMSLPNSNPMKLDPLAELLIRFLKRSVLPALLQTPNY